MGGCFDVPKLGCRGGVDPLTLQLVFCILMILTRINGWT